jgi:succinoglycan biosynthesis protein ExoV
MKYLYYKDEKGNFGDDLNPWLWDKLFSDEELRNDGVCFLGIGTILYNNNPLFDGIAGKRKLVFGSGVRKTHSRFLYDESWKFLFVRGPWSARVIGSEVEYITDAAYAIRSIDEFDAYTNLEKTYELSFMPYFRSVDYIDWPSICSELGIHYISPFSELGVEFTLAEISKSRRLITEAMHGAILSDILRVPWTRFVFSTPYTEGELVSEFKWNDWLHSINLYNTVSSQVRLYRKTPINRVIRDLSFSLIDINFFMPSKVRKDLLSALSGVSEFYLSEDSQIEMIDDRIEEKIQLCKTFLNS